MAKCPHERIQFCPLFVESHNCRGLGCVDDMAKDCEVVRGKMNYTKAIDALRETDLPMLTHIQFSEIAFLRQEQRARNLKVNGIRP